MKNTAKAKQIMADIDKYIAYYYQAQSKKPGHLHLSQAQVDGLGLKPREFYRNIEYSVVAHG